MGHVTHKQALPRARAALMTFLTLQVHVMLGEYGVVLAQYERLMPHHIYNQAPPSELPAPHQQGAVWDEAAAAQTAAMSVEGAVADLSLQQQVQADSFQLGGEQMPLEDGFNLQQRGQSTSAEAGLLGSQHQQEAPMADEFGLQQQGDGPLPSMAEDFDLSAGQPGAADDFGLPSLADEFGLGSSHPGAADEFGLQSPQTGGADEFGLGGSKPQAIDEFGLHGGEPDAAADFDLRSSPLPAVADGLGLEAASQAGACRGHLEHHLEPDPFCRCWTGCVPQGGLLEAVTPTATPPAEHGVLI